MNDDQPAAFLGSVSGCRTMADGTLRISVDLAPGHAKPAFTAFGSPGDPVAIARIENNVAVVEGQIKPEKPEKGPYGEYARALIASGFFRSPDVWQAVDSDEQYLEWLKRQPSALSKEFSEYHDDGECYSIPAHYRRVSEGAGTGIKPPYSAIPLTDKEHKLSHQHGDSAIGTEEWWQTQRIQHLEKWAQESLKDYFGVDSWTNLNPATLRDWAIGHSLAHYLPAVIRSYAETEEG